MPDIDEVPAGAEDSAAAGAVSEAEALEAMGNAIAMAKDYCKRFDPEEEPYKSKYLAREALRSARAKLAPHASEAAMTAKARLDWRLGAVSLDVEESFEAEKGLDACLAHWCPGTLTAAREVEEIESETDKLLQKIDAEGEGKAAAEAEEKKRPTPIDLEAEEARLAAQVAELGRADGERAGPHSTEVVEALCHLGILHHNFARPRRAMLLLKCAERMVNELHSAHQEAGGAAEAKGGAAGADEGELASVYTHVCFYLAQAYAATKQLHQSASYCQVTLDRQLSMSSLDPYDWYKNCCGLMDYFVGQERYHDAEHCLRACERLLDTKVEVPTPPAAPRDIEDARERLEEARADVRRRWGILHLNVLQDAASNLAEAAASITEAQELAVAEGRNAEDMHAAAAAAAEMSAAAVAARPTPPQSIFFGASIGLGVPASSCKTPADVRSFDDARAVFKAAHAAHTEAMRHYVLDGCVTDHVALQRDVSQMYRWLAVFETDEKRKLAMYMRRTAALRPLLDELGKKAYEDLHKTLSFEVGEVSMELAEMKSVRIRAKQEAQPAYRPKAVEITKVNQFLDEAVDAFQHFVDMYRKEKPEPLMPPPPPPPVYDESGKEMPAAPEVVPIEVDDDELGVYLRAHFYIARLHNKWLPPPDAGPAERCRGLKLALEKFEWLRGHAREKLPLLKDEAARSTLFADELAMADQMVELLPEQISRVHYAR